MENHCRSVIPTGLAGIITGIMLAVAKRARRDRPVADPGRLFADNQLEHLQWVYGTLPGMMYYQILAGAGGDPVHRSTVGCGVDTDPYDRCHQYRRQGDLETLRSQEIVGEEYLVAKRLDMEDVNIYYGPFHAVAEVSLAILPRSVTSFIGRVGLRQVDGPADS